MEVHRCFEAIENYKASNDVQYTTIAVTLVKLHSLVIEKSADIQELNIYDSLKEEYYRLYDNFIGEVTSLWHENIFWNDGKEFEKPNFVSLVIQCDCDQLTDIINALHSINRITRSTEALCAKLLQHFINPIIHCDCDVQSTDKTFSVEVLDKKRVPTYKTVLNHLHKFFEFLHKHFDIVIQKEECYLTRLSISSFEEFSYVLTNDCISKIIPTSTSELETFKSIISEIQEFQNYLVEIKFISEEQKFLSKYTNNIDQLYIDKKCEKLLEIARTIMKKDLHDSFRYKSDDIEEFPDNEKISGECGIVINRKLSKNTFLLPECQIRYRYFLLLLDFSNT